MTDFFFFFEPQKHEKHETHRTLTQNVKKHRRKCNLTLKNITKHYEILITN